MQGWPERFPGSMVIRGSMFRGLRGEFDEAGGLFAGDGGEAVEEFFECGICFEMIEQGLDGDSGAAEAGRAAQAIRVDPDDFGEGGVGFGGHRKRIALDGPWDSLAYMDYLPGADLRKGGEEIGEEGEEAFELVGADVDDDEAEAESVERLLVFDALVDGQEDVEMFFGVRQQMLVGNTTPSGLGDCFYRVAWKGSAGTSRDAFV